MKDLLFITGNAHKAKYLELWLERPIAHRSFDIPEIQSLDLKEVVTHKAAEAYRHFKQPVLVEDVALTFNSFGKLPGTLVKWFITELGAERLSRLLENHQDRSATAEIIYALHDGRTIHYFEGRMKGHIAEQPRGDYGFGWNSIFIPEGQTKTYGELSDEALKQYSHRALAIAKLRNFLDRTN